MIMMIHSPPENFKSTRFYIVIVIFCTCCFSSLSLFVRSVFFKTGNCFSGLTWDHENGASELSMILDIAYRIRIKYLSHVGNDLIVVRALLSPFFVKLTGRRRRSSSVWCLHLHKVHSSFFRWLALIKCCPPFHIFFFSFSSLKNNINNTLTACVLCAVLLVCTAWNSFCGFIPSPSKQLYSVL